MGFRATLNFRKFSKTLTQLLISSPAPRYMGCSDVIHQREKHLTFQLLKPEFSKIVINIFLLPVASIPFEIFPKLRQETL